MTAARLRLKKDLDSLELPAFAKLNIVRDPMSDFKQSPLLKLTISPNEGFYEGGNFVFDMEFNENYPIEPPAVRCLNRIFHPNIDTQGKICLNILREDWSPALDVQSIILGLIFLFLEVGPENPLNKFAASVLSQDKNKFADFVKRSIRGACIEGVQYDFVL